MPPVTTDKLVSMLERLSFPGGELRGRGTRALSLAFAPLLLSLIFPRHCACAEFEFVVIGDTRPTFESENFRNFEQLIPKINAAKPALVVNVGDLIYGYGLLRKETQWDKYEKVIQAFEVPYFQLPGNHDTHSRDARRVYARRFGKFYESFNHGGCHFVLLDNTEPGKWGCLGTEELQWLKADLKQNTQPRAFVFLHFPLWEPERVSPRAHQFWAETLHPLFLSNRVSAVFGGHYHSYGPTREFDGIRYFITGGGGAELRPEYKRSGGEFHFVKVRVKESGFDVRVATQHGDLTDTEADVMGGLQFADRNSSRIGLKRDAQALADGVTVPVSLTNPYKEFMTGQARWVFDASSFSIDPAQVSVQVPAGGSQVQDFNFRMLKGTVPLEAMPRLEFNVVSGGHRHRFNQEVRFVQQVNSTFTRSGPRVDGDLDDWGGNPLLSLPGDTKPAAQLRSSYDSENLYFAVTVPTVPTDEEEGPTDDLQIGIARRLSDTSFGGDFLRMGFNFGSADARNRTPNQKKAVIVPGVRVSSRREAERTQFEIALPLRLLSRAKPGTGRNLVFDLSFRALEDTGATPDSAEPRVNTFAYRVRYGSDSLVPVYFIELNLDRTR